jgi:hypothetical protein
MSNLTQLMGEIQTLHLSGDDFAKLRESEREFIETPNRYIKANIGFYATVEDYIRGLPHMKDSIEKALADRKFNAYTAYLETLESLTGHHKRLESLQRRVRQKVEAKLMHAFESNRGFYVDRLIELLASINAECKQERDSAKLAHAGEFSWM